MKNHFTETHPLGYRFFQLLWLALLTAGFLVLYYFYPLKPVAFAVLLRRTALVFAAVFLAALVYRLFRTKNLFPEAFVKAVLRIASAALALAVVFCRVEKMEGFFLLAICQPSILSSISPHKAA